MVTREILLVLWILATVMNLLTSYRTYRRNRKTMALITFGMAIGTVGMVTFYVMLLFFFDAFTPETRIAWSRWAISLMGLMTLFGSTAGFILNKG